MKEKILTKHTIKNFLAKEMAAENTKQVKAVLIMNCTIGDLTEFPKYEDLIKKVIAISKRYGITVYMANSIEDATKEEDNFAFDTSQVIQYTVPMGSQEFPSELINALKQHDSEILLMGSFLAPAMFNLLFNSITFSLIESLDLGKKIDGYDSDFFFCYFGDVTVFDDIDHFEELISVERVLLN